MTSQEKSSLRCYLSKSLIEELKAIAIEKYPDLYAEESIGKVLEERLYKDKQ